MKTTGPTIVIVAGGCLYLWLAGFCPGIETSNYEPRGYKLVTMNVSAYCPCQKCCGFFSDGVTAHGHVIQPGDKFVAAPPDYGRGTIMTVPGYGTVPVLDRGGAIKGNKLDVFFPSHQTALNWGRRKLVVKVHD